MLDQIRTWWAASTRTKATSSDAIKLRQPARHQSVRQHQEGSSTPRARGCQRALTSSTAAGRPRQDARRADRLGDVGVRVIKASQASTVNSLNPGSSPIGKAGDASPRASAPSDLPLHRRGRGPDPRPRSNLHMGDYVNLSIRLEPGTCACRPGVHPGPSCPTAARHADRPSRRWCDGVTNLLQTCSVPRRTGCVRVAAGTSSTTSAGSSQAPAAVCPASARPQVPGCPQGQPRAVGDRLEPARDVLGSGLTGRNPGRPTVDRTGGATSRRSDTDLVTVSTRPSWRPPRASGW